MDCPYCRLVLLVAQLQVPLPTQRLLGETLKKALHALIVAPGRGQMGVVVQRDQVFAVSPRTQLFNKGAIHNQGTMNANELVGI